MVNVGLVGLGKMGLSHLAILKAHQKVKSVSVCDSSSYLRAVIEKYTGTVTYDSLRALLDGANLDAILIATPSHLHAGMVRDALESGLHVFCEKPFCLDPRDSTELAALAISKGVANQVGYHYRFVGTFKEAKRLIETNAIGRVHHIRVESYGPVVLRPKGGTWRLRSGEGGGCLYDYACHAIDLVNFLVGPPKAVGGVALRRIFSKDVDDEVYATLYFDGEMTGQIAANWSDESFRRMSTEVSIWGSNGRIVADRQEIKCYIRDVSLTDGKLRTGWNEGNITELSPHVEFYLRGEEYSEQIDYFINSIDSHSSANVASFASAAQVDEVVSLIRSGSDGIAVSAFNERATPRDPSSESSSFWRKVRG